MGGWLDPPWAMKYRRMPLAMAASMGTSVEFQKNHDISTRFRYVFQLETKHTLKLKSLKSLCFFAS